MRLAPSSLYRQIAVKHARRNLCMLECAAMSISFSDRVKIPDDVLISNLQEESVILNLDSERYYGLDDVGTRILSVLTTSDSIEAAYETLLKNMTFDRARMLDAEDLDSDRSSSRTHGAIKAARSDANP